MGSVKDNGGARKGAGRKPKADEQKLIEKLSPLEPLALKALKEAIQDNQSWAVKMYMEYVYGKPRERKDINITEIPIIDMNEWK